MCINDDVVMNKNIDKDSRTSFGSKCDALIDTVFQRVSLEG